MLLYNVTVKIAKEVEPEWLQWMQQEHIPAVLESKQFLTSRISRLLDQPEEEESTYVIQYSCESRDHFNHYLHTFASALRDEHNKKYQGKFVAFRTLMEVIS